MARKWILSCFLVLGSVIGVRSATVAPSSGGGATMEVKAKRDNLTAIQWVHAVNSRKLLTDALNSNIDMIEADIILGTLVNSTDNQRIPVMGHPPANTSDISFEVFLKEILEYNEKNKDKQKGVKLDFKSTIVFQESLKILNELWPSMKYPIWLNADIIEGPVDAKTTKPVDPTAFFNGCKMFDSAILSIGWTTRWGSNYTLGSYTDTQVNKMLEAIRANDITNTKHEISFPVRAGIAAQSLPQLRTLFTSLNDTNKVTLTIWSTKGDKVDIDKLRDLILSFGVDKVYVDVPDEVSSKLNLGEIVKPKKVMNVENATEKPKAAAAGLSSSATTLVHISIIALSLILTCFLFKN